MSTLAQVLHVARKDLVLVRWLLLTYAVLLALGMFTIANDPRDMTLLTALLATVVTWVLVGMAAQSDPATRPDAFWVTRPLNPTAVFCAKLVVMAVVIAAGVAAQLYAMSIHGAPARELLAEAGTLVLWLAALLSAGLAVASLTRDLAGFMVASIGLLVLLQVPVLLVALADVPEGDGRTALVLNTVLWSSLMLALGAWQYRRRDARRGRIVLVVLVLAGGLAGQVLPAVGAHRDRPVAVEIAGEIMDGMATSGRMRQVTLYGTLPLHTAGTGSRALLLPSSARLVLPGGPDEQVHIVDQRGSALMMRLMDDPIYAAAYGGNVPLAILNLTEPQLEALRAGAGTIVVDGEAVVQRSWHLATIGENDKGVHTARGIRVRVDPRATEWGHEVAVVVSGATEVASPAGRGGDDLVYTLVGAAGDTLRLMRGQSGSGSGALVLLSGRGWHQTTRLRIPAATRDEAVPQWPTGARLRITGWQQVDSYRVRITAGLAEALTGTFTPDGVDASPGSVR